MDLDLHVSEDSEDSEESEESEVMNHHKSCCPTDLSPGLQHGLLGAVCGKTTYLSRLQKFQNESK